MRKTLGLCLLVLLLTGSASAGIMPNDSPAPAGWMGNESPAQPADATQGPTANGEVPNDATDALMQAALDLLSALPSLL